MVLSCGIHDPDSKTVKEKEWKTSLNLFYARNLVGLESRYKSQVVTKTNKLGSRSLVYPIQIESRCSATRIASHTHLCVDMSFSKTIKRTINL